MGSDIFKIFSLKGKVAVVIGGGGALCSKISLGLGKAGAEIAICDILEPKEVISDLEKEGIKAKSFYVNVLNINTIKSCKNKIIKEFGGVDILINGAGGNVKEATTSPELTFFDLPQNALKKVFDLNLFGGSIFPSQIFGKVMAGNKEGGAIINISSMNAYRPLTTIPGYSAAKAAVSNFTQWLAVYFAQEFNKKVRVNAIAPGFFLTKQLQYLHFDKNGNPTERARKVLEHTPMGEYGSPEDLIGVCIWLASSASRFVTGIVVPVDGGFNAYSGV